MYIIASHYSNEHCSEFNSVSIEQILYRDKDEAIKKATQFFEDSRDNDLDADSMVAVETKDIDEFKGAPIVFGVGEYEEDNYSGYHLIYAVLEVIERN